MGYRFVMFKGKDGQWYWRFQAPNNQIVAVGGEGYENKADCKAGINLVAGNSPGASIYEQ